jgi:catechol 2,3-dioxygenase-like lactoylglutathione lyase family enzyme
MAIKSIWHTSFTVSDIERSIVFYRDCLGLRLHHRQVSENEYTSKLVGYEDARLLIAQFSLFGGNPPSNHVLELIEYQQPRGGKPDLATSNVGIAHLAFQVDNIDAMLPVLSSGGAKFVSEPQFITAGINRGGRTVYLRDPDGITLELVEAPPRQTAMDEERPTHSSVKGGRPRAQATPSSCSVAEAKVL